jgi:hypothetical protein
MAYEDEILGASQQEATARKLRESAQMPTGQMAGGWYVPPSNMQYLAEALKQFTGAYSERKARLKGEELTNARDAETEAAMQDVSSPEKYARLLRVNPEIAQGLMAYEKANKPEKQKAPIGFEVTSEGSLKPMQVEGYGDYGQYQMGLAGAKAQIPGYGEPQRLQMAQEGQNIQKAHLDLAQQNALRQERAALEAKKQSVPPTHKMVYSENETALKSIDNAINKIKSNPNALGLQNLLGENISQRMDKKGVPVRAAIAEIGSKKIHDLSGAAVSASESPRLMPFIPATTDNPDVAIDKLNNLKRQYQDINSQIEGMYSNPSEYKNPIMPSRGGIGTFIKRHDSNTTPEDAALLNQLQQQTGGKFVGGDTIPDNRGSIGLDAKQQRLNELRAKHGLQ